MTIDNPWNLDPTSPASNSSFNSVNCAEGMAPSLVNNVLRQLGSFLAQATSYKSADISASVSTNIAATGTGLYMNVVGANAINHFGSPAGAEQPDAAVFRFLQYASSASVSHGANIKLFGSVSRKMQPGDMQGVIHDGSGVWREFCRTQADGNLPMDSLSVTTITNRSLSTSAISTVTLNAASASISSILLASINSNSISASIGEFTHLSAGGRPAVLFHGRATNAAYTTLGTILPYDNSIPQNTEGDEVLSLTVTPTNASSILRIDATLLVSEAVASGIISGAIFVDSTANAIYAGALSTATTGRMETLKLTHYQSAASTTQRVYRVRAGSSVATDAMLNGDDSTRIFGGVGISSMEVTEFLP